jgi:hypothetical protein
MRKLVVVLALERPAHRVAEERAGVTPAEKRLVRR